MVRERRAKVGIDTWRAEPEGTSGGSVPAYRGLPAANPVPDVLLERVW